LEPEPDAGLGNGGVTRLATGFAMKTASSNRGFRTVGTPKSRTTGSPSRPWEVPRLEGRVEIGLSCSFELRGGSLRALPGRPSTLTGVPFDRPVVGYGGKTINKRRLWATSTPDYFDFQEFQPLLWFGLSLKR
jgi:starch phosphorylase